MRNSTPTLHLLCGKIASGKSTLTAELASAPDTVVIAEDAWLKTLYGDEMVSITDYARCMSKLRKVIAPHVVSLLEAGLSVVLDFQANTVSSRDWMRDILDQTSADHKLHVLDVPDAVCIARLHARNAQGEHPFAASEAEYWAVSRHFVAPSEDEGFNLVMHRQAADP